MSNSIEENLRNLCNLRITSLMIKLRRPDELFDANVKRRVHSRVQPGGVDLLSKRADLLTNLVRKGRY